MHINMSTTTLVLLPHQDDEIFIYPVLSRLVANKRNVKIIYLTNGNFHGVPASVRNIESLLALSNIGVTSEDVIFLGNKINVEDGKLINRLEDVWSSIIKEINHLNIDQIFSPAFEGGHQDHDACNVLAQVLARKLKLMSHSRQFFLYTAAGAFGKFYRVIYPGTIYASDYIVPLRFNEIRSTIRATLYYKSQLKTWIGLLPELTLRLLFLRRIVLRPFSPDHQTTYKSIPLYEKWGRMSGNDFLQIANRFIDLGPRE